MVGGRRAPRGGGAALGRGSGDVPVDEFEELVIGYFVVYVFLDFVKEGNLLWRGKGLRGGGTG